MRRKPRVGIDLRDVAIYTRKSKLTHMGDSTGIQMKQNADFARSQLNLPEDYCFLEYEDKGLSGYYADRPDFQRMLHDIEAGKIRAVVCYKLDRISRKTSDLLRLIDFFNKHEVALLVCSNNINTLISTSKIMISFLAIIAEFERDIIAERIADNLIELAKDGRWMGGCTPTGFKAIRNTIGSGKNKTSITHLEPIPDEKKMVQQIFKTFRQCRSINKTATTIGEDYKTKFGKEHTSLSIKDILSNPIYCTADEISFDYFYQKNGNICSDEKDFDAIHGIMAYNKTDQERLEDEESTFIEPKFVQVCADKPIAEWIISVGKHEGFIPYGKAGQRFQGYTDAVNLLKIIKVSIPCGSFLLKMKERIAVSIGVSQKWLALFCAGRVHGIAIKSPIFVFEMAILIRKFFNKYRIKMLKVGKQICIIKFKLLSDKMKNI